MANFRDIVLDIVFPRCCLDCNILLRDKSQSYLCHPCLKAIPFTKGFACAFCRSPVRAGKTCVYCIKNYHLDRLLVATTYENLLVKKIIKAVKYRFVKSLAVDMADLMIKYLKKRTKWLMVSSGIEIASVPLHSQRLNWRGFNQAEIIAKRISKSLNWPIIVKAIKRVRNPKPQTDMPDKQSRIENMLNVFTCLPKLDKFGNSNCDPSYLVGKTILLVDDVSTTGSTLNDCARALKGAGAKEVIGFVFARGKLDQK